MDRYFKMRTRAGGYLEVLSPVQIKDKETIVASISKSKRPSRLYMYRRAPWRSKRKGYHSIASDVTLPTRIHPGKEMSTHAHTQTYTDTHTDTHTHTHTHTHTREDPEKYYRQTESQAKQEDCLEETQKKCSIKVIQTTQRAQLSL